MQIDMIWLSFPRQSIAIEKCRHDCTYNCDFLLSPQLYVLNKSVHDLGIKLDTVRNRLFDLFSITSDSFSKSIVD